MKLKVISTLLISACLTQITKGSTTHKTSPAPHKTTPHPKGAHTTPKPVTENVQAAAQLDHALQNFAIQNALNNPGLPGVGTPQGFLDRTNDKFQQECLKASNVHRKKHKAGPFQIEPQLVEFAKSRCKLIVASPILANGQNGPADYGENIYLSSSKDFNNCTKVIEKWYSVIKGYDYKNPQYIMGTGQFTQLVWVSTTGVGCSLCGAIGNKGYTTYVVCNYNPSGNYQGEYPENVLKP